MKPNTRRSSLLALAAVAATVSPAVASAQAPAPPSAPFITETISATAGLATPSIGNGTIAWAVLDNPADLRSQGTTIWTLRDGKPAIAAKLPALRAHRLEAGTDAAGNPVAIVSAFPPKSPPAPFYLVRLDTGEVRRLSLQPHARLVSDVAIDAGRVIYATSVRENTFRGRSSLWSARLKGGALTQRTRLRRSRPGETFETVRADRGRITATAYRKSREPDGTAYLPLYAGTARGLWRKIGTGSAGGGGLFAVEAAGFSRDRRSVIVTTTGPGPAPGCQFDVQRVPLRSGHAPSCGPGRHGNVTLENPAPAGSYVDVEAAYEPGSDRLLVSSRPYDGEAQLGWSSVLG